MNLVIVLIAFGLIGGLIVYLLINPTLPTDSEKIIGEIDSNELPKLIKGTTGYSNSNSTNIWFETKSNSTTVKGTVILDNTGHVMTNYYIDNVMPDLIKVFEKGTEETMD